MNKKRFLEFVQDYILKMFTGSEIVGEEPSSTRDNIIAQSDNGGIKIKFSRDDNYRIIIKRAQPFKMFEMQLIKSIILEMTKIINSNITDDYKKGIKNLIIERAICKSLSNTSAKTLISLLTELSYWGQRTYEGNHTTLGFVVTNKKLGAKTNQNLHISKFLQKDFSAVITDGISSFIELSADGYISNYISKTKYVDESLYAPYNYLTLATLSTGSKIGLALTKQGDVLIFKNKCLLFAKRNGIWICYSHEEIVGKLSERAGDYEDVRKSIYLSALDTSFLKTGGCIVHINSNDSENVLKHIDVADVFYKESYDHILQSCQSVSFFSDLNENKTSASYEEFLLDESCTKTATLKKLINGKKFQELDRKFRQELISIDGAVIIDFDGKILAVGAIIKIEAGSSGGGRLAAAKTLSNYGISIKISNDGIMTGFKMDKNKLRAKAIFTI